MSEVGRIGSIIVSHVGKRWKANFFNIQCDVIFLVMLQGKFYHCKCSHMSSHFFSVSFPGRRRGQDSSGGHGGKQVPCNSTVPITLLPTSQVNPFTPESDQCQNSPEASQEIWHHTVWRTWLFIAYSDEKGLCYKFSLHHSYNRFLKGWENTLFELRSERVNGLGLRLTWIQLHLQSEDDVWVKSRCNNCVTARDVLVVCWLYLWLYYLVAVSSPGFWILWADSVSVFAVTMRRWMKMWVAELVALGGGGGGGGVKLSFVGAQELCGNLLFVLQAIERRRRLLRERAQQRQADKVSKQQAQNAPGPGSSKPNQPNPRLSWNFPGSLFLNMRQILYQNTWITMLKTKWIVLVFLCLTRGGCRIRNSCK